MFIKNSISRISNPFYRDLSKSNFKINSYYSIFKQFIINFTECFTNKKTINIFFQEGKTGNKIACIAPIGKSVLDVALDHDIDIEGACGGELACSTCHVILSEELYKKMIAKLKEGALNNSTELNPQELTIDFEHAVMNAFNYHFPRIKISTCFTGKLLKLV
jgi:ferredoxin